MKKVFSDPEIKIIRIESKDVICDSCGPGGQQGNEMGVDLIHP